MLAGQGQCGIIVRAKVKMVPAKALALNTTMLYFDVHALQADLRTLVYRNELDSIYALNVVVDPTTGARGYVMNLAAFHDASTTPDMAAMTARLVLRPRHRCKAWTCRTSTFQLQVDNLIASLRSIDMFDTVMHPWFDVFVPDSAMGDYVEGIVSSFQPDDVGQFGFVLLFPLLTSTITRPLFRLPDEELVWLFDVLTAARRPRLRRGLRGQQARPKQRLVRHGA